MAQVAEQDNQDLDEFGNPKPAAEPAAPKNPALPTQTTGATSSPTPEAQSPVPIQPQAVDTSPKPASDPLAFAPTPPAVQQSSGANDATISGAMPTDTSLTPAVGNATGTPDATLALPPVAPVGPAALAAPAIDPTLTPFAPVVGDTTTPADGSIGAITKGQAPADLPPVSPVVTAPVQGPAASPVTTSPVTPANTGTVDTGPAQPALPPVTAVNTPLVAADTPTVTPSVDPTQPTAPVNAPLTPVDTPALPVTPVADPSAAAAATPLTTALGNYATATPTNPDTSLASQTILPGAGLDYYKNAADQLATYQQATAPQYDAAIRQAERAAAATGSLGSGQLNSALGDLALNRVNSINTQGQNFLENALNNSTAQNNQNYADVVGQQGFQQNQGNTAFNQGLNAAELQAALQGQSFNQAAAQNSAGQAGNPSDIDTILAGFFNQQGQQGSAGLNSLVGNTTTANGTSGTTNALLQYLINQFGARPSTNTGTGGILGALGSPDAQPSTATGGP